MAETTYSPTQEVQIGQLWWAGLLAAALAVAGNIMVQVITSTLFIIPMAFAPFQIPNIAFFSVVGVAGATGVFALLGQFTQRPVRWFWIISAVVLLLSFIPNIAMLAGIFPVPGTTIPGAISLMIMHVVTAVAAVGVLIGAAGKA